MRVLSQDGKIDIPYEQMVISIDYINEKIIVACGTNCDNEDGYMTMARYSTEAKARKTMEMLHGVYVAHENYKKLDGDVQIEVSKRAGIEKAIMYGGIFQFPADDEVEV